MRLFPSQFPLDNPPLNAPADLEVIGGSSLGVTHMHRRQYTKGLDPKRVTELTKGWEHATRIGRPLNVLITIRPFEEYDATKFCTLAACIRNKLGVYARQHRFPFVAAWTRECNTDGTGEHVHVLMHVPPRHFADLEETVLRWHPEPGAADVRHAHQNVVATKTGIRMSAIGYIAKQMTPQAWYKRGLNRKAGGPILGKRGGVTRNIGPLAIEEYFGNLRAARPMQHAACSIKPRSAPPATLKITPEGFSDHDRQ
jgi:hypothetical protein